MSKQWVITIDLSATTGSAELIRLPGTELPRHDKKLLELTVATRLLGALDKDQYNVSGVRSNPSDPPDVLFALDAQPIGIELTELLPPNRFEKDSVICNFRRSILDQLSTCEQSRNKAVHVLFVDTYSEKIRTKRREKLVARVARMLEEFFVQADKIPGIFRIFPSPPELSHLIAHVMIQNVDLSKDPRITHPDQPLIVFDAQNTLMFPDEDLPKIVKKTICRKEVICRKAFNDLSIPTWLVLWNIHPALANVRDEVRRTIRTEVLQGRLPYSKIIHFDLFPGGGISEFLG